MDLNLSHTMTFLNTPDDKSGAEARRDYISKYINAMGMTLSRASLENLVDHTVAPVLVDREKMLGACSPLGQDIAVKMEWQLIQRMGKEWHIPPDEQVLENTVGVLAVDYFDCPAGNLVIIRRTDRATIAFLLECLRVDVKTLQLQSTPNRLSRFGVYATTTLGGSDNGNATFEECTKTALEALSTLAFALPEPWGVITSAGIGLILAFFPDSRPNPFEQLEKSLITFQKHADLSAIAMDAQALTNWINVELAAWKIAEERGGSNDLTEQIKKWESKLDNFMEGGRGTVWNDLQQIQSGNLSSEEAALSVFVMTITAFLNGQKFAIILDGLKASVAKAKGDTVAFNQAVIEWRISYNALVIQVLGDKDDSIVGFTALIDNWIAKRIAERLSKISAVRKFDYAFPPQYVSKYGPPPLGHIESAFEWRDDADGGLRSYFPDRHCNWTGADCTYQTYEEKANREHDEHLNIIGQQLDAKYKKLREIVRGWQSTMFEWSNNMPPGPAKVAPIIDDKGWESGEASPWKDHKQVQYAIAFGNKKGPGEISPWSNKATISGINPKVTISVDQMQQATKRWVYRQFDSDVTTLQCIFVMDNTTTDFVDGADTNWVDWKLSKP